MLNFSVKLGLILLVILNNINFYFLILYYYTKKTMNRMKISPEQMIQHLKFVTEELKAVKEAIQNSRYSSGN